MGTKGCLRRGGEKHTRQKAQLVQRPWGGKLYRGQWGWRGVSKGMREVTEALDNLEWGGPCGYQGQVAPTWCPDGGCASP